MLTSPRLALLASVGAAALTSSAAAQSTADLFDLGEIVVEGSPDPTAPVSGYVAPTAQTATKSGRPVLETAQSISVVTGEQIEDQGATTLGDTLTYTSGVFAQPFGTDPRFDSPTIRGFDGSNAQYLNGLRILRDFGAPSFEIYSLERIEILKGPASVLYGSGIPGGVINQVQKRAQPLSFGEVGVGFGDPQASEAFVDYNHRFSDTFSARFTSVVRDSEEDIAELTNTRGYLGVATLWTPTPQTRLQFLGSFQQDNPITPTGAPTSLLGQVDADRLRDFYFGDPTDDNSDRTTINLGFEFEHEFESAWTLNAGFRYQNFDWDYRGFFVQDPVPDLNTVNRGAIDQFEESETYNLDLRLSRNFQTGAVNHDVLVGLDLRKYSFEDVSIFRTADPISFLNPVYSGANVGAITFTGANDLELEQFGLYLQDEMSFGNWRASLALRRDWADQNGTTFSSLVGTVQVVDQSDTATTGRAGLLYLFDNGMAPYVSYATSFDPEIGSNIEGNQLEPTKGEQWEAGLKYEPPGVDAFFSAAIFDLTQSNISANVVEGGARGTRQIGEAKSRGLELEASASLGDAWNIRAAYTYNDTEQTRGDNVGNELPNAPQSFAGLWANYTFAAGTPLENLTLGGGVRFIGDRFGDDSNNFALDDVTLLDLQIAYKITDDAHFSLNVTNVTDKNYLASCSAFGCRFGDGRTVQARLTYKW